MGIYDVGGQANTSDTLKVVGMTLVLPWNIMMLNYTIILNLLFTRIIYKVNWARVVGRQAYNSDQLKMVGHEISPTWSTTMLFTNTMSFQGHDQTKPASGANGCHNSNSDTNRSVSWQHRQEYN